MDHRIAGRLGACTLLVLAACSESTLEGTTGPWIGTWVQVNFLATDDNDVWDPDDLSGIGFVQTVTASEWVVTDNYGDGCAVTFSYTVGSDRRFTREALRAGSGCPPGMALGLLGDTGRLEFSPDEQVMIEWYDLRPGDDIVAFKFVRR